MSQTGNTVSISESDILLVAAQKSWERFSYYGVRTLLVLYLIHGMADPVNPGFYLPESSANLIYGWYAGLLFLVPAVGSSLAARFIGTPLSILLGGLTLTLGHTLLAVGQSDFVASSPFGMSVFYGGLVLAVLGTGYFKPDPVAANNQTGSPGDDAILNRLKVVKRRLDLGTLALVLLCGTLGEGIGWTWGFLGLAVGMLVGLIIYLVARLKASHTEKPPAGRISAAILFVAFDLSLAALVGWLYQPAQRGWLSAYVLAVTQNEAFRASAPATVGPVLLLLALLFVGVQEKGQKAATAAFLVLMIFYAFFWFAFHQVGSSVNVFANQRTNRFVYGWETPTTWFQAFYVLLLLLFTPVLRLVISKQRGSSSLAARAGVGLILVGIAFGILSHAGRLNAEAAETAAKAAAEVEARLSAEAAKPGIGTGLTLAAKALPLNTEAARVSIIWLALFFALLALGEVWLSPAELSYFPRMGSGWAATALISIWSVLFFIANVGSGFIASSVQEIEDGKLELFWYRWFKLGGRADFFLIFAVSSVGAGIVALLFNPWYRRMVGEKAGSASPGAQATQSAVGAAP
jgi:POT family proton-dependent oligopeptide transporter